MELKELRIRAGLKQSDLSALSGVNLRSLQDYEQGHKSISSAKGETLLRLSNVLGCSIEDILGSSNIDIELSTANEELKQRRLAQYAQCLYSRRSSGIHFPIIESDELVDMSRIYPTKQAPVKRILVSMRQDSRVATLLLFGSSISMACHRDSDIDLAVGLANTSVAAQNEVSEKIQLACDWDADIIWLDHLTPQERIYTEIQKGLTLI